MPAAEDARKRLKAPNIIEIDTAVVSIGQTPNPLIKKTTKGLDTNTRGCIIADEQGATSKPFVYAGGDVVTGAATVILAMGAGKQQPLRFTINYRTRR